MCGFAKCLAASEENLCSCLLLLNHERNKQVSGLSNARANYSKKDACLTTKRSELNSEKLLRPELKLVKSFLTLLLRMLKLNFTAIGN